jgi:citrate synthase
MSNAAGRRWVQRTVFPPEEVLNMPTIDDVHDGLEGVLAFASEIAEPDRHGGALRYRGVDLDDLVGVIPFEAVWGLLVDGRPDRPLAPAGPHPLSVRTGDTRVDVQSAIAALAPEWGLSPLVDLSPEVVRDQLARVAATTLSFVAQSARGRGSAPVPQEAIDAGRTLAQRFLLRWRGEADPGPAEAIDAYWITAAEHGMNASTFTARVIASTGADIAAALSGAVGALSGPLHGGAPARVLTMLDEVERTGDADRYVAELLHRGERIMGFGHRVYRAEDPRARALRRMAQRLGARRVQVATELERAALTALAAHKPDRVLATNVEFWSAVVLDHAQVPQSLFTPLFVCARTAGWSAHILEQHRTGRLIRPSSLYVGPGPRPLVALGSDGPVRPREDSDLARRDH